MGKKNKPNRNLAGNGEVIDSEFLRVYTRSFDNMLLRCSNDETPGVSDNRDMYKDYSAKETTPGQLGIEEVLLNFLNKDSKVLHVGVGNSKLAVRFAPLVAEIIGMTISPSELQHGLGLGISNYQVLLWNKYREWESGATKFDAIIDNNPGTFACCFHHMTQMFAWYAAALDEDGAIFTEAIGLEHTLHESQLSLNYRALAELGRYFGLRAVDIDGNVYALAKNPNSRQMQALREGFGTSRVFKRLTGFCRHSKRKAVTLLKRIM
jgi:hypothetical protein